MEGITLRIVTKKRLAEFWDDPKYPNAKVPLTNWYRVVRKARWENFAEVKKTFNATDLVGNKAVFDVGGNIPRHCRHQLCEPYRLHPARVLDHKEYDKGHWKKDDFKVKPPRTAEVAAGRSAQSAVRRFQKGSQHDRSSRHREPPESVSGAHPSVPASRPLGSDEDLDRAIKMVDELTDRLDDLDEEERDYLEVSSAILIEVYEDEHVPIPTTTDSELLRYLIEAKGVTQAQTARGAASWNRHSPRSSPAAAS